MPRKPTDRLLLSGLLAINVVLRLLWLGANDLAHDEPFTIYWSQRPLPEFLAMLATENNPPLYFLLIKGWSLVAPFEAAWLRVPSALAGAAVVWPLFLLVSRIGSTGMAVTASLLLTFSNYHQGFAHEVRAYALFTLLATLGYCSLVAAGQREERPGMRHILMHAAVNTLMVYSHILGWLALGSQLLMVLVMPGYRRLFRAMLTSAAVTVACSIPYMHLLLQRTGAVVTEGTWLAPPTPEELYNMVWRWSNAPVMAVIFLALIAAALVRDRMRSPALRLGSIWALVPLLGMFLVSRSVPLFLDRYLVFAAPGFALLVAASAEVLARSPRRATAVAILLVSGMAFTFTPWRQAPRQPSRVVEAVNAWGPSDHALHVVPSWYWLNYHAATDPSMLRKDLSEELTGNRSVPEGFQPAGDREVVVVDATGGVVDVERHWQQRLRRHFSAVDSVEADHKVWVYRFHN